MTASAQDHKPTPCPLDHFNRQFRAPRPNVLSTQAGFVYVAFVIDAYARRIVGWRVSRSAHSGFMLDALEQALHDPRPAFGSAPVHHCSPGATTATCRLHV